MVKLCIRQTFLHIEMPKYEMRLWKKMKLDQTNGRDVMSENMMKLLSSAEKQVIKLTLNMNRGINFSVNIS